MSGSSKVHLGTMLVAIDPGSTGAGAAAWGTDEWPSHAIAWTWRKSEVWIANTTGEWLASCDHDLAEAEIAGLLPLGAVVLVEGLFQPRGAMRGRFSVGSTLPLAEHVGRLIQAIRGRYRVRSVLRPLSDDWRPAVGIPARTQRDRAEGHAVEIAWRAGWRMGGTKAAIGAASEAVCMYRAARVGLPECAR